MLLLGEGCLDRELAADTLNVLLKYEQDVQKIQEKMNALLPEGRFGRENGEEAEEPKPEGVLSGPGAKGPPAGPGQSGTPSMPAARTRLDELLDQSYSSL